MYIDLQDEQKLKWKLNLLNSVSSFLNESCLEQISGTM
jgi:hypothetical protein